MPAQQIRIVRLSIINLLLSAVMTAAAGADSLTIKDNMKRIRLSATHKGGITSDKTHDLTHLDEWAVEGFIKEDSGSDWDELTIKGEAWHVEAPHEEAENTRHFKWKFFVDGSIEDNNITETSVKSRPAQTNTFSHEFHRDKFVAQLVFKVETDEDILSYVHSMTGRHTDSQHSYVPYRSTLTADAKVDTNAFGSVVGFVDQSSGLFDLTGEVLDINPRDLLPDGAHIHNGSPPLFTDEDVHSAPIFTLPSSAITQTHDGLGIDFEDEQFPVDLLSDLLGRNAYLHLHTRSHPAGELSGILGAVDAGDVNGDGITDSRDVIDVQNSFGLPGGADLTGDGLTDALDLAIVRANQHLPVALAVPEPATSMLLVVTLLVLIRAVK